MADAHVQEDKKIADGKVLLGVTPKGKEIYFVRKANKSVRFIAFGSGGQLPEMLEGGYSSISAAKQQVESYLAKLEAKEIDEAGKKVTKK